MNFRSGLPRAGAWAAPSRFPCCWPPVAVMTTTIRSCAGRTSARVSGSADTASATYSWKGIPYAQPPVGNLRWAAPQEPAAWSGNRRPPPRSAMPACSTAASTDPARTTGTTRPSAPRSTRPSARGLSLPERLAAGHGYRQPAGDRLLPRRQQCLRLHGRPGVRRRGAGQGRQRRRGHAELPPRDLRIPERARSSRPAIAQTDSGNFALLDSIKALRSCAPMPRPSAATRTT